MSLLTSVKRRIRPNVVIAKWSVRAIGCAMHLNGRIRIDLATKAAVDRVRAEMARNTTPREANRLGGYKTHGEHAVAASSKDENLAMLQALIRRHDARSVLEIGTAYGVGSIALAMTGADLTTIEGAEPAATLGRENIRAAGLKAECIKALKEEAIPELAAAGRKFDLVFHDGGHLGDAYVNDFANILPMLNPGAVFVIDNVFHDDWPARRDFTKTQSRRTCREAWNELLGHPRVGGALIYRKTVGIMLVR